MEMQFVASDICNNNPVTLEGYKTLYDARNILIKYNISRIVILNDKEHKKLQESLQRRISLDSYNRVSQERS
jgi:predicted transcriptional regulator